MIVQPKEGSVLSINDVNVSVRAQNFLLNKGSSKENMTGQGSINYFIDVPVPTTIGKLAVSAAGTYVHSQNASYTWKNVSAGTHNFSIELVDGNNTPLNPPVMDTATVTIANLMAQKGPSANIN
jgi:hypothetical protein